jgi:hypothetical protein
MARDEAYRKAEQKIEEARRTGATELDLSCRYDAEDSEKLTELPESLGQLTQLQTLYLQSNQLTGLPESLGQLTQLQTLNLFSNQLRTLPKNLGLLHNLRELQAFDNWLNELPESVGELKSLETLVVNANEISQLPSSIGQIDGLKSLWLGGGYGGNQVKDLPTSLAGLKNLESLELSDNPLNPELAAAYEQSLDAVKAYLRAKAEDQIVLNEAKLILIGEGEVGKTSLLGALRGDEWVENRPTTHGVEVDIKTVVLDVPESGVAGVECSEPPVDDSVDAEVLGARSTRPQPPGTPKKITFNAWDFGGQNIYRHTHTRCSLRLRLCTLPCGIRGGGRSSVV